MEQTIIERTSCYSILDASLQSSINSQNMISLSSRENISTYAKKMVSENAVIIFCRHGCCMSHVVKRLLQVLGVNPTMFEVDAEMENQLITELKSFINDGRDEDSISQGAKTPEDLNLPAVFLGGKYFGGVERVVATHITGDLVPLLKDAGALWL